MTKGVIFGETTGLAFDLPDARWMDDVKRLRARHESVRSRFPIEITVAGSSGLGWFAPGQSKADLIRHVGEVARGFAPFTFRFDRVARFPNSNVYYLEPRDSSPFQAFQSRLAGCGLSFAPVEFTYVPHCTIAILAQGASADAHAEVMGCPVPTEDIVVSSVTFWSVDHEKQEARRGETMKLGS